MNNDRVLQLASEPGKTQTWVAKKLNEEKYPHPLGRAWTYKDVSTYCIEHGMRRAARSAQPKRFVTRTGQTPIFTQRQETSNKVQLAALIISSQINMIEKEAMLQALFK